MKTLKLFLEAFEDDEAELQMGKRISNIDLAHSLALTTCSFEFECYLKIEYDQDYDDSGTEEPDEEDYYLSSRSSSNQDEINSLYNQIHAQIGQTFRTNKIKVEKVHGKKTFKINNPDYWFIEPDSSLTSDYDGYVPVEIISPWVPIKDADKFLSKFKAAVFDYFDGITDDTTGMHSNFRTKGVVVNPLKLLALLDEDTELATFKRTDNQYTEKHKKGLYFAQIVDHYDLSKPAIMKHVIEQVIDVLDRDKYKTVNFKDYNFKDGSGRIEFRIIGDDYFGDLFDKTLESVNRFGMLIATATDEGTHHEDVITKLKQIDKDSDLTIDDLVELSIDRKTRLSETNENRLFDEMPLLLKYMAFLTKDLKVKWKEAIDYIKDKPAASYRYAFLTKQRFPEGEEAIAKSAPISLTYARDVLKGRFPEGEEAIATDTNASFNYANIVLKGPFEKGEPAILKDKYFAYNYMKKFHPKGWKAGESVFKNDAELAYDYAKEVLKGRFEAGEDTIANNHKFACDYAIEVLKGPFPKGEKAISENAVSANNYAQHVLKGRFPKAEALLARDPNDAYRYAVDALKGPFPKGEEVISKHAIVAFKYAKDVLKGRFERGEPAINANRTIKAMYDKYVEDLTGTFK